MIPSTAMTDVVNVEEHATYRLVDIKSENMRDSLRFLETRCVGSCTKLYRLTEHDPSYSGIKSAFESGQQPILRCYHKTSGWSWKARR